MNAAPKPATKPAPKSRTPRRSISIASDPLDAPSVPAADAEPSTKPARAAGRQAAAKPAPPAPEPPMINPALRTGEESWDEEPFKLTANIPKSLHRRAAGLVVHAQMFGLGDAGDEIASLTDLVRIAIAEKVTYYEKERNNGAPFPAPRALHKGRR